VRATPRTCHPRRHRHPPHPLTLVPAPIPGLLPADPKSIWLPFPSTYMVSCPASHVKHDIRRRQRVFVHPEPRIDQLR
jgi:hypothetical protein